jgi:beta-glucosidase
MRPFLARSVALLALCAGVANAQRVPANAPYRNARLPVEQRVSDLLGRMTLDEKVAQMLSLWQGVGSITNAQGNFDPSRAPKWFRTGIGRIERASGERSARQQPDHHLALQPGKSPPCQPTAFHH